MKHKKKHYTLMFFPEGKGEPFSLTLHRRTLKLVASSVILFILGVVVLVFKSGDIALRLQLIHTLKEENSRLKADNEILQISSEKIAGIESLTVYLHRLASFPALNDVQMAGVPKKAAPSNREEEVKPQRAVNAEEELPAHKSPVLNNEHYAVSVPNILPVNGWITRHFSTDTANLHLATDFAAATGTPIVATAMGVVENIRSDNYVGLMIEIRHENGFVTRYGHCSQILVPVRERVSRGQTIALVGNTGRSTAPHLHYEILKDGKPVNMM
ncbi:MAG: M23 family metallopeptidase, partial [Chitinispirillales bacterium]|nr:M23 family metallopeptidase [Chitinispirillales bacterium]